MIVSRNEVEEFLGQLEGQGYLADRLELPLGERHPVRVLDAIDRRGAQGGRAARFKRHGEHGIGIGLEGEERAYERAWPKHGVRARLAELRLLARGAGIGNCAGS